MTSIIVPSQDGGLLVFDGSVIEYFGHRNRQSDWRIHARHVESFEFGDHGKGTFRVKVMVGAKHFQNAVFDEARRGEVEQMAAAVQAVRT